MTNFKVFITRNSTIFYNLIGFFSKIVRKIFYTSPDFKKHKSLAVCGRGFSVNKFFDEDFSLHSKVYLANYMARDLAFRDYLKLRKKEISIISAISEQIPSIFFSLLLDIKEVILSRPFNMVERKGGNSIRELYRLNCLGLKVRGIKNCTSLKGFPMSLRNTGILALYEACLYAKTNNIKVISIYGFDFYSTDKCKKNQLIEDCANYKSYIEHKNISEELSIQLDYLLSLYPEILFKNFTLNKYQFKSENIQNFYQ